MRWKDKEGQAELRRTLREQKPNVVDEIRKGLGLPIYSPWDKTELILETGKVFATLPKGYSDAGYHKSVLCRLLVKLVRSHMSVGDIHEATVHLRGIGKTKTACEKAMTEAERVLASHRAPVIDVENMTCAACNKPIAECDCECMPPTFTN